MAQEATRQRNSRRFLLQPTSSLLSGLMYLTDCSSFSWLAGHMRLTKSGKARTKTMRLIKSMRLTASSA